MLLSDEEFGTQYRQAITRLVGTEFRFSTGHEDVPGDAPVHRMSGIGGCARRQYYRLVLPMGEPTTSWTTVMGHAGQQIVAAALRTMGYMLEGEETTVEYGPLVGHVDGLLRGHDLGERLAVWDNKVKGAWAYRNLLKNGIRGDAEIYMQIQCYILATGAELALVTVVPADLNTNISLMRQYKVEGDPVINRMVYTPDTEAQELAVLRAQELNVAIKMGVLPSREFNPDAGKYPCTYCPFLEQCQIDGAGDYTVSPIPSEWFDA